MTTSDRSKPIPITIDKRTLDASVNAVAKLTDQVIALEERVRLVERQRDDYATHLVMLQMDRDEWEAKARSHTPSSISLKGATE